MLSIFYREIFRYYVSCAVGLAGFFIFVDYLLFWI